MDKRLDETFTIDFKAETKRGPRKPRPEPDWENRTGESIRPSFPGDAEECRLQLIQLLRRCLARLEGAEPQKAWEPRSQTWPWTRLGLALLKAIALCDAIGAKVEAEAKKELNKKPG
jgi:hypothetical protein